MGVFRVNSNRVDTWIHGDRSWFEESRGFVVIVEVAAEREVVGVFSINKGITCN